MSIETWGVMNKSQIDPELVEDAIDRIVGVHNDDPDAHLADGQSLTTHRAAEIIDHLANSIVEDKIATGEISSRTITTDQLVGKDIRTDTDVGDGVDGVKMTPDGIEMWFDGEQMVGIGIVGDAFFLGDLLVNTLSYRRDVIPCHFESLDAFTISAYTSRFSLGTLFTETNGSSGQQVNIWTVKNTESAFLQTDCPDIEIVAKCQAQAGYKYYLGMGGDVGDTSVGWIAFYVYDSVLYMARKADGDATTYVNSLGAFDPLVFHKYRVSVPYGGIAFFYIDDVYVGYITTHLPTNLMTPFVMRAEATASTDVVGFTIKSFIFQKNKNY